MKKKIVVISSRFLYPVVGGDRLRIYQICKSLSKDFNVTFICLTDKNSDLSYEIPDDDIFERFEVVYLPKWKSWINCIISLVTDVPLQVAYYKSKPFTTKVAEVSFGADFILCHLIRTAQFSYGLGITAFMEMTDIISFNYSRIKNTSIYSRFDIRRLVYKFESSRLKKYEYNVLKKFKKSFLVSDVDLSFFKSFFEIPNDKVEIFSNGVDIHKYQYDFNRNERNIVFIGNMQSYPNIEAVFHFVKVILPLIRAKVPDAKFKIVGRISERDSFELQKYEGVVVTGEVLNVTNVSNGAVGICPMRIGAGIQNKILEYMALGLPVVTSEVGFEGLSARRGIDLLVADNDTEFALSVVKLMTYRDFAEDIAINARCYVEKMHSWDKILYSMNRLILSSSNN